MQYEQAYFLSSLLSEHFLSFDETETTLLSATVARSHFLIVGIVIYEDVKQY